MFKITTFNYRSLLIRLGQKIAQPKFLAVLATGFVVLLLCIFTPLKTVFNPPLFKSFIGQYQGYVEIIFIAIYTLLTVICVPGTVLTIVGGCLFGIWYGTLISIVSATSGALCAFWAARYLFRNSVQRRFSRSKRLTRFQSAVLEKPFWFVLTTRLVPISPYNLVNYLFGLTTICWRDYALATLIGVIPGCLAYSWLGKSGEIAIAGGDRLSFFLALTFLALLSVIPLIYQHQKA